jgi:hypothetical protein
MQLLFAIYTSWIVIVTLMQLCIILFLLRIFWVFPMFRYLVWVLVVAITGLGIAGFSRPRVSMLSHSQSLDADGARQLHQYRCSLSVCWPFTCRFLSLYIDASYARDMELENCESR